VVNNSRRYLGYVTLRELVLADPNQTVRELAHEDQPGAHTTDDAEEAARLLQDLNVLALTVVDSEDRVVGVLTIDDAFDVIEAAGTEAVSGHSGAGPCAGHYMAVSVLAIARSRVVWLLLLIVASTLTVG